MAPKAQWDWSVGSKTVVDLATNNDEVAWREESHASPDGEQVAAVVRTTDETYTVQVNDTLWESQFDRVWYLRYSPDGRLTALVNDGDWKLCVDEEAWEEGYGFVWNTLFSEDGSVIACSVSDSMQYGMIKDGEIWPNLFANANNFVLSADGAHTAAAVQTEPLGQAEIFKFKQGVFSVAVDGEPWERNFVNVWTPSHQPQRHPRSGPSAAEPLRIHHRLQRRYLE